MSVEQLALYMGIASGAIGILSVLASSLASASRWVFRARRSVAIVALTVATMLGCGLLYRSGGERPHTPPPRQPTPVASEEAVPELPGFEDTLTLRAELDLRASPLSVACSCDGRRIACGTDSGEILLFDPDLTQLGSFAGASSPVGMLSFSADGKAIISGHEDGMVRVWNVETQTIVREWKAHDGSVIAGDVSPDGLVVCTGGWDGTAVAWDLASGKARSSCRVSGRFVPAIALGLTGAALVGDDAGNLLTWEVGGAFKDHPVIGYESGVRDLDVSSEGSAALSALEDGSIRLWNPKSGEEVLGFRCHAAPVDHVAFLTGASHAVSAACGGVVEVWDLQAGRRLVGGCGHDGQITGLAVCSSRGRAVSVGDDRAIRIWELNLGSWAREQ